MQIGAYSLAVSISYLIGSLPTGYLAGMARGIDIRAAGSGNIGATNVFRVLGNAAGIAVLAVDGVKGFAAARWMPLLADKCFPGAALDNLALAAGAGAVLGHIYTCWLKFKGGKGIATSAGVGFAWAPEACAATLAVWGVVFLATRYVSVASIAAAVVLPVMVWCFHYGTKMTIVMTALSVLAIYKHKANIRRLLDGTENRAEAKRKQPSPSP
ncbi:MAG TPA: glycerol-3-phosphate 1-O-acyltransferase PlsY [Candidatus Acidoferrum sp.]|nr:glycerol-3-phosphate 1-O-acyltransferase PlsY [Candidatus Acidoferrum sp.]